MGPEVGLEVGGRRTGVLELHTGGQVREVADDDIGSPKPADFDVAQLEQRGLHSDEGCADLSQHGH